MKEGKLKAEDSELKVMGYSLAGCKKKTELMMVSTF